MLRAIDVNSVPKVCNRSRRHPFHKFPDLELPPRSRRQQLLLSARVFASTSLGRQASKLSLGVQLPTRRLGRLGAAPRALLHGRATHHSTRAEHAAMPRQQPKHGAAGRAHEQPLTRVGWHRLPFGVAVARVGAHQFGNSGRHLTDHGRRRPRSVFWRHATARTLRPHHVTATRARARGRFTCTWFQGRHLADHLVCEQRDPVQVIGSPIAGCAYWQREPGSDDELLRFRAESIWMYRLAPLSAKRQNALIPP